MFLSSGPRQNAGAAGPDPRIEPPGIRLSVEELGGGRHICGLYRGPAEADGMLVSFEARSLAKGERVVHVGAAASRGAHLSAVRDAGVDVDEAVASARLKVEVWDDTYLRGGRFDQTSMLALIVRILAEGRSAGFSRTLYVADMAWALQGREWVQEVVEYEARFDRALRKLPDIVICAYDLERFETPVVVDLLAAHSWALVGGSLKPTRRGRLRAPARDRILQAADRLFREQGIQSTSVNRVIATADVAKATLYRHFPTKDDLIVGWLRDIRPSWFDRVRRAAEARAGTDKRTVPVLLFDAVAEWLVSDGFRGCPYLNTSVEIVDPGHPANVVVREFLADMEGQLRSILRSADMVDPETLAAQLQVMIVGSISLAVSRASTESVMAGRHAAVGLLTSAAAR